MISATSARSSGAPAASSPRFHFTRISTVDSDTAFVDRIAELPHASGNTQLIGAASFDPAHFLAESVSAQVAVRPARPAMSDELALSDTTEPPNAQLFSLEERTYKAPTKIEHFAFRAHVHERRADALLALDSVRSHYHRIVARALRGAQQSPQAKSNSFTRLDTHSIEYAVNALWNRYHGAAAFPLSNDDGATYSRYLELGGHEEYRAFRTRIVARAHARTYAISVPVAASAIAVSQATGGVFGPAIAGTLSTVAAFRYHGEIRNAQPQHLEVHGARPVAGAE